MSRRPVASTLVPIAAFGFLALWGAGCDNNSFLQTSADDSSESETGAEGEEAFTLQVLEELGGLVPTPTPGPQATPSTSAGTGLGSLAVRSGGAGALLVTRNPSSNRLLVAEEGVGRWQTFQPAGLNVRVSVLKILLKPDGQSILATTPFGIYVGSLTSGSGHVASGTSGGFFLDVVCADAAARSCVATAVANDTATSVYRSTDGGESWARSGTGLPASGGSGLFALISPAAGVVVAGTLGSGIYRSADSGASWTNASSGLPQGTGVQQFAASGGALFAATGNGLFKSVDGGSSWSAAGTGLAPSPAQPQALAVKDGALYVAMYDTSSAAAGGVYKSTDGGATFQSVGGTIPAARFFSVAATSKAVYAGTSAGVFRTLDGGATWTPYNDGLRFADTRAVAVSGGTVYQGVYEGANGVYRSGDGGGTWLPGDSATNGLPVTSLAASGSVVVAGTDLAGTPRGLLRSTDAGATWVPANTGVDLSPGSGIKAVALDGTTFYAAGYVGSNGSAALYRSVDQGASWTSIGGGIPDASRAGLTSVYAKGSLLVAGGRNGTFRSTDGGATWSPLALLSPLGSYDSVSGVVAQGGNLFAGLDTGGFPTGQPIVFVSRDQGASWTKVAGTVPAASVGALAATADDLFAGTSKGVHRSTDGGATWSVLGIGLGDVKGLALTADALWAGIRSDGLRKIQLTRRAARLVPIVLDVDTGSAHYTTELALTNTGTTRTAVTLRYTASIGTKEGSGTVDEELAPGKQLVLADAIAYLRGKGLAIPTSGAQGGTLLVTFTGFSGSSSVSALARTATATASPQPVGRAGLAYSGLRPDEGATTRLTLYGLRSNATDRSNVAVFSMSDQPVSVKVTAYSGDPDKSVVVVADRLELPPYGWTQFSGILQNAGLSNGYVTVERVSTTGSFSVYGVVNDQVTSDGSYVLPVEGTEILRTMTVPVLVEAGSFLSELVFANRSDVPATFDVTYLESLNGAGGSGTVSVVLAAREQRIVPDAIGYLRSKGLSLPAKGTGSFAGTLRVKVSGPSVGDTFVGARTASQSSGGGQFGLFTPALYGGSEASWTDVFLYGLRADASNRSNVAVFSTGGGTEEPISLQLQVYDGDAGGAAKGEPLTVTLAPGQWSQPANLFASRGVKNGWVRVTRTSGNGSWGAYGVVNDGASSGERTGDGAYIPPSF